jgi:hypothetical protein
MAENVQESSPKPDFPAAYSGRAAECVAANHFLEARVSRKCFGMEAQVVPEGELGAPAVSFF